MTIQEQWVFALTEGNVGLMRHLVLGQDVNQAIAGLLPIHIASKMGHISAVQWLLENGAKADAVSEQDNRRTALHGAAMSGCTALVQLLVDHNATVNAVDVNGDTPYNVAKKAGKIDVVRLLHALGGRPGNLDTVLVFGAGFTKAFFPTAPVLVDTHGVLDKLLPKYEAFPAAKSILETELDREAGVSGVRGKVNLERLMTRLASRLPYDDTMDSDGIMDVLLSELKHEFTALVQNIAPGSSTEKQVLHDLAVYCLKRKVNCITFNYDDLFDQALIGASTRTPPYNHPNWDLEGGYGFYSKNSVQLIGYPNQQQIFTMTPMKLLKLHGSINWRLRRGASQPYDIDGFFNHELWPKFDNLTGGEQPGIRSLSFMRSDLNDCRKQIEQHLEPDPFIIPPILSKADLANQPLLKLLWGQAFSVLNDADQIVFVGYSLPITDIAASFLFVESTRQCLINPPKIQVVDYAPLDKPWASQKQAELKAAYRLLFPKMKDSDFRFDGALDWATNFVSGDEVHQPLS